MMFICCIEIYENQIYKLGELCNRQNHYISFLYPFSDLSEEVIGKLNNNRIKVKDAVYVGLKVRVSDFVTVVRDGVIRELFVGDNSVYFTILLNDFVTPNSYFLDFFKVRVGKAAKDKLVMYGGKNE